MRPFYPTKAALIGLCCVRNCAAFFSVNGQIIEGEPVSLTSFLGGAGLAASFSFRNSRRQRFNIFPKSNFGGETSASRCGKWFSLKILIEEGGSGSRKADSSFPGLEV